MQCAISDELNCLVLQKSNHWNEQIASSYCLKKLQASSEDPKKATRPSAISSSLSNMAKTSEDGWWMVTTTVFPLSAMCLRTDTTFCAMKESRPDVGSSQNMSGGSVSTWRSQQSRHSPEAGNLSSGADSVFMYQYVVCP